MRHLHHYRDWLLESHQPAKGDTKDPDIDIRLGRSKSYPATPQREAYTTYNIIVSWKGKDITGQAPKGVPGEDLGDMGSGPNHMYVSVPEGKPVGYVGSVRIPEALKGQGLGRRIYQAVANHMGISLRNSWEFFGGKDYAQSDAGRGMWARRDSFDPQ